MPYGHAALMCSAYGDREGVLKYARLAREAVGLKDGEGVGDWGLWDRVSGEPEGHWSWGKRRRASKGNGGAKAKGKGKGKVTKG